MTRAHSDGYKVGQKGAWTGILSNILLFVLKFSAGIFGRSQAMIADAFHTASDTLTSVGVLIGFKIAQKPPDEHHPLGHGRAESIAAKIVSLVLLIVGVRIAYDSAKILIIGEMAEPGLVALLAAVLSIIVKEITYRRVIKAGEEINSTSLKADAFHHRSDVLSSVAALIGIAGAMLGKTYLDPLAGVIVGGFIIKMGAENFHAAYDELMDAAPPEEFRRRLENIIIRVKGVKEIKKIMVRKTGIEFFVEAIIGVGAEKTVEEGHLVTMKIKKDIVEQMPNVKDIIVHVEPAGMETD